MKDFKIGDRHIGKKFPPLIIAEIGINHGGDLNIACEMVDAAFRAGVELIKHQTHVVHDEMSMAAKAVIPGNSEESIYEIMRRCALSWDEEIKLKEYVESKGMMYISTPFSRAAADQLESMNVLAYKIGSGECNNYPLVKHIASFGKPIILSTGMNTIESISKSVKIFEDFGVSYALMHTTNLYPTPYHLVRLGAMVELGNAFPGVPVGLSDHTINNLASFGAISLGASIIERHFTDRMDRIGPDIICSMDEAACRELIEGANILHQEIGGAKGPVPEEQITMDFAFSTVVAISKIKAGDLLNENNIWVKRPGIGELSAEKYEDCLGRYAMNDIDVDQHLSHKDVNWGG